MPNGRGSCAPVITERLATARLDLVPVSVADAEDLAALLADPALYRFIGGEPPTVAGLEARIRGWLAGPTAGAETWHNWVARLRPEGPVIGHLQATVENDRSGAEIAWVIGTGWQGRGYASEAAGALVAWIDALGVASIVAHVHPDHVASAHVAANAGLRPTDEFVDGERTWRRDRP